VSINALITMWKRGVASSATCLAFPALQPYTLYSKENDKEASRATKEIMQQQLGGGEHRRRRK